jgi:hypothetical protein
LVKQAGLIKVWLISILIIVCFLAETSYNVLSEPFLLFLALAIGPHLKIVAVFSYVCSTTFMYNPTEINHFHQDVFLNL